MQRLRRLVPRGAVRYLKAVRAGVRQLRRGWQRAATTQELAISLRHAGFRPGDVVMVHSSLSSLGKVTDGADTVIQALVDTVTSEGSILMPVYGEAQTSIEASRSGQPVDLRTAPSMNGLITETFRRRPDVVRSSHPFSSVCAWGKHRGFLTEGHDRDPRICHRDSPVGRLLELGGKIVGLGVSLGPVSFYHVVEDTWPDFPLDPYLPAVPLTYIDAAGSVVTRPVQRYDPQISRTRIDRLEGEWIRRYVTDRFIEVGILQRFPIGHGAGWVIHAKNFYSEIQSLAQRGITIYTTEGEFRQKPPIAATRTS